MRLAFRTLLGAALSFVFCAAAAWGGSLDPKVQAALEATPPGQKVPVIVAFDTPEAVAAVAQQAAARGPSAVVRTLRSRAERSQGGVRTMLQGRKTGYRPLWIINALAVEAEPDLVRTLAAQPGVKEVRLNETVRLPEVRPLQVGGTFWNLEAVRAPELWSQNITGTGAIVAILDSGVDGSHPLLAPKWRGNPGDWFNPFPALECGQRQCTLCEANGATPCDDVTGLDTGHGTAVAGIVLGGDGVTTTGVAPGAKWIAAKIFRDNDSTEFAIIHSAFQWALDPNGDGNPSDAPTVVNNSWGIENALNECFGEFRADVQALKAAGIGVVFAGGNGGPATSTSISPGNYPEDFAVGALEPDLGLALFSARGPSACTGGIYPGAAAPGVEIHTTFPGAPGNNTLAVFSGTSFSAPHLAGILALLRQASPAPMAQLEEAVALSATDLGPQGPDNGFGNGMVDALAALRRLQGAAHMGVHDPVAPENDGRLPFGAVFPGLTAAKVVTVYNQGGGPLTIGVSPVAGSPAGAFAVTSDTCTVAALPPGGNCALTVAFTPSALGSFSGRLTLAPASAQAPFAVVLEGSGQNVPTAATLISPADGSRTETTVTFRWNPGTNPDGQPVTDTLLVSETPDFITSVASRSTSGEGPILLAGAAGMLATLGALGLRRRRGLALLLVAFGLALLAACGGGSGDGNDEPGVGQTVSNLSPGTTYFWKIVSRNAAGGTSESEVRSFTVL